MDKYVIDGKNYYIEKKESGTYWLYVEYQENKYNTITVSEKYSDLLEELEKIKKESAYI